MPFDLIENEADIIIAIDVVGAPKRPDRKQPTSVDLMFGATQLMMQSIIANKLKTSAPRHLLRPPVSRFRVLDFLKIDALMNETADIKDELKRAIDALLAGERRRSSARADHRSSNRCSPPCHCFYAIPDGEPASTSPGIALTASCRSALRRLGQLDRRRLVDAPQFARRLDQRLGRDRLGQPVVAAGRHALDRCSASLSSSRRRTSSRISAAGYSSMPSASSVFWPNTVRIRTSHAARNRRFGLCSSSVCVRS